MSEPMMLVDVARLEHFVPSSDRGVSVKVRIDGVMFFQLTTKVYAEIHRRVELARAFHETGQLTAVVWGAIAQAHDEIRAWAVERWGEDTLAAAIEEAA